MCCLVDVAEGTITFSSQLLQIRGYSTEISGGCALTASSPKEHGRGTAVGKASEAEAFVWGCVCITWSTWNVAAHKELGSDGKGD